MPCLSGKCSEEEIPPVVLMPAEERGNLQQFHCTGTVFNLLAEKIIIKKWSGSPKFYDPPAMEFGILSY